MQPPLEVWCAADRVVDPVFQGGVSTPVIPSAAPTPSELLFRVEAARPRRPWLGETESADESHSGDEDAERPEPRLSLQEGDEGERDVDGEDSAEHPMRHVTSRVAPFPPDQSP